MHAAGHKQPEFDCSGWAGLHAFYAARAACNRYLPLPGTFLLSPTPLPVRSLAPMLIELLYCALRFEREHCQRQYLIRRMSHTGSWYSELLSSLLRPKLFLGLQHSS